MSERSYTVREIDDLRRACEKRWLYGTTSFASGTMSRSFNSADKDRGVEEMVRTFMLAGATAEDIYAADKAYISERIVSFTASSP